MKASDYRAQMSEDQFEDTVIALAKLGGWQVAHFRPAKTAKGWRTPMKGDRGFPDLVLARSGVVLLAELKVKGRRLSVGQAKWGAAIGDQWRVWRPADLEAIRKELT